jgi:hypothetical protein
MKNFFETLYSMSQYDRDVELGKKAKEIGAPKRTLQNDFKAFVSSRERSIKEERHQKSIEAFNSLFGVQDIVLPNGYYLDDGYICFESMKICKAFTFLQRIQTEKTQFLEFASLTDNRIVDVRDMLKSDRLAVEFGTRGEYLDTKRASLLSQFIGSFLIENETKISTIRGADRTGWNDKGGFDIPNRGSVFFVDEDLKKRYTVKGTLNGEVELLRELGNGKVFLLSLFALSSTFYGIFDIPINFIAHVGGLTGEGKSFAIKSAMSLFGEKDLAKCGKNWNATLNGLETYWERTHSMPVWVDEMESARAITEVVSALYVFSEGTGKSRAFSKDGEISERAVKTFKGVLFSTGEKNLSDIIKKTGESKNKPLGIVRRALDFSSVSLWQGVNKKKVGELIDRNHGNFIDFWVANLSKIGFDAIESRFYDILDIQNVSLDAKEYIFALMELSLSILREIGVIDAEIYNRQLKYIMEEIRTAYGQMNEVKNDFVNFLDDLNNYVGEHRTQIKGMCNDDEIRGGVIGKFEEEKGILYLNNKSIDDICSKYGYVWKQVRAKLYERELLISLETKKQKFLLTPMRCFMFDMQKIENFFDKAVSARAVVTEFVRADGTLSQKSETVISVSDGEVVRAEDIPF